MEKDDDRWGGGQGGDGDDPDGQGGRDDEEQQDCDGSDGLGPLKEWMLPAPPVRLPAPGQRLGGKTGERFEIQEQLGDGALGVVFRAWDSELQRDVALKFLCSHKDLTEEARQALTLQEARLSAQLKPGNIVLIHDVSDWVCPETQVRVPFLVMECLQGQTLQALLKRLPQEGQRLELDRVLAIASDLAEGLVHVHGKRVIHRDIKPSNVFITEEGRAVLLDFGLAHLLKTPTQSRGGTPSYMAPEQWRGEDQDERTDLWAVGVMLYEMLAGQHPYPREHPCEALRARVCSAQPVPSVRETRPDLPLKFAALLDALLAKDPRERLGSAVELRERLEELKRELTPRKPPASEPSRVPLPQTQRRPVTLVSCLLTGLPEQLDPEDLEELLEVYQEVCGELLQQHGGAVLDSTEGRRVLACFVYPTVQEQASECAAWAGLELTRTVRETIRLQAPQLPRVGLAVQVGLHTDVVTLPEGPPGPGASATRIRGAASALVHGLAEQAPPDGVLLSADTHDLVRAAFLAERLGRFPIPAHAQREVEVFRLLRERRKRLRFRPSALTPLVGRERELRALLDAWDAAHNGQGTVLLVSGEAGLGKSRLLQELRQQLAPSSYLRVTSQCWSQFSQSAYHPLLEMLRHLLRLSPRRSPERNLLRLEKSFARLGLDPGLLPPIASLLSLPVAGEAQWRLQHSPERRKEKTFEALLALLLRLAQERPVLAIIEDLHWADPSTLQFLGYALERLGTAPLGIFLTMRPEFRPAWSGALRVLQLERLSPQDAATLVREAAAGCHLAEEIVAQLVERTDGVPLYIEELVRSVLARAPAPGVSGAPPVALPLTLHEPLLARLNQLPQRQKDLALLCAVVGRSFNSALLEALTQRSQEELRPELEGMRRVGLVQPLEGSAESGYQFHHALLQEAVYNSLTRPARRRIHARIAQVLARRFPQQAEAHPELIAHHATEAGDVETAIRAWSRAGALACRRSASHEAVGHLDRALALLRGLPNASQRLEEELQLLTSLGLARMQVEGCSQRLEELYARAWELILAVGEALPRLDLSSWGFFSYHFVRARFREAHAFAEHLVALGEGQDNRELLALGLRMVATDMFTFGAFHVALDPIERALACSDFPLEVHRELAMKHWIEPRTAVLAYASVVHSVLLRWDEALDCAREAVRLSERLGHPHTRAFVLTYVALGCQLRREPEPAQQWASAAHDLAREHSFRIWEGWSRFILGWAKAALGRPQAGLALLDETLGRWQRLGFQAGLPAFLGIRAELLLTLGRPREALENLREALERAERTNERSYMAELYRFQGEGFRALGQEEQARECFLRALQLAREQGAHAFAQRAQAGLNPHPPPRGPAAPGPREESAYPEGERAVWNMRENSGGNSVERPVDQEIRQLGEQGRWKEAVGRCIEAYGQDVRAFMGCMLYRKDQVDDAFSHFSECVLRGLPSFKWKCSLKTWLFTVARHSCYHLGRGANAHEHLQDEPDLPEQVHRDRSETDPWVRTEVKELFRALMRERLKPEELQLLHLRTLEELPWRDIARIMSDSAGEPSPGELERFAGALRQQFQRLKVRLQEIAVDAGLLAGLGEGGSPTLETVSKLERALKLLRGLPDASQRAETEFQLLMALGLARLQVEGCSPKLEATYARARELLFQVGEALPRLELSYWGIYSYDLLMGRFGQAHVLSQHLVTLGERLRNQELLAHGLRMMASDLFIAGDHPGALAHVERALPCSNFPLDVHRKLAMKQWLDPRASALAFASLVYSVAAQWDRARECTQEAVELAGRIGHPYTRAFVLAYAALGCQLRGEPASAVEWARAAQRLSHEHRFRVWESWARLVQGWAMAMRGEFQEGLERFDASLDQWRRSGFQAGLALFLGMRAEVLLRLGRPEEALETTTQGLAEAERTGERTNVAELHRLRGESLRLLGREDLAQASFLRALVLAREQGAHAFAQRAEAALSGGGSWDAAPH